MDWAMLKHKCTLSNLLTLLCTLFTVYLLYAEVKVFLVDRPTSTSFEHKELSPDDFPDITVCIKPAFKLDIAMKYGYQDNYYYRGSSDGSRFIGWRGINSTTDSLEILEEILSIKTNQTFLTAQLA